MATTTYQLTADHLVAKYGAKAALEFATNLSKRGSQRTFWKYVAACIAKIVREG